MIGRVVSRPKRPFKLLEYLFGPGRKNEHVCPHLVAAWAGCPERLEPPGEGTQGRWTWRLAQTLLAPTELARGVLPENLVWHCVVRAAPGDRQFDYSVWQPVTAEMMHRTGLSVHGEEDKGCRWVAEHHGGNHVHVVAVLARLRGLVAAAAAAARTEEDFLAGLAARGVAVWTRPGARPGEGQRVRLRPAV